MKKLLTILIILLGIIVLSGCTLQFKAKEIELEGHTNTSYEFTGFAWTESPGKNPDPPD